MAELTTRTDDQGRSVIETEGHLFVLSGSTTCPSPELCEPRPGEDLISYTHRHANDHRLGHFDADEDAERNLGVWCLYYFHKYLIGNPSMVPWPHWEMHEFVNNWTFDPIADLDGEIWEDQASAFLMDRHTFKLPPANERGPNQVTRRFKELEVPRGSQKTSCVVKAWVTQRHLRKWFLEQNPYHRTIVTSATMTHMRDVLRGLTAIWRQNANIKRLYGADYVTAKGDTIRIGLLTPRGGTGQDILIARWQAQNADSTGMAGFSVRVAGVMTELAGQRAEDYVFDDPATKKNSMVETMRERIRMTFADQVKQLDPNGYFLACNTRKHIDDFGGTIKTEYRDQFHIMHRRAWWLDPKTKEAVLYFEYDGDGKPKFTKEYLEAEERRPDYWPELMNMPQDPTKTIFKREDFKIINPRKAPPEVQFGLGRPLTDDERVYLQQHQLEIVAYNACDPAGKERQTKHGDESAIVGMRIDRLGAIYITYIAGGQWGAAKLWDELWSAFLYNRPKFTEYEMGADELHIRASYEKWQAEKNKAFQDEHSDRPLRVDISPRWSHMPKVGKTVRIEQMENWTRNGNVYILSNAASHEVIQKFIDQWVNYLYTDHDDYPDATSRLLKWLMVPDYTGPMKGESGVPEWEVKDGITHVPFSAIKDAGAQFMDTALWGERGGYNE